MCRTNQHGKTSTCINIDDGYNNVKIHNNNLSYCRMGIFDAYSTMTSGQFYNNTIDYSSWMLVVGDGNNNSNASGVLIYGNTLGPHFQAFLPVISQSTAMESSCLQPMADHHLPGKSTITTSMEICVLLG